MANRIVYDGAELTNATIIECEIMRQKSPFSDPLSYDTVDAIVDLGATDSKLFDADNLLLLDADGEILEESFAVDFNQYVKGTPCEIYHNAEFLGKFYIQSATRVPLNKWRLQFVSALGILNKIPYNGGIYDRVPAGDIINAIMGGEYVSESGDLEYYEGKFPYYLQKALKDTIVSGWLPRFRSSRDALHDVLYAVGGSVLKTSDGTMKFTYWQPTAVIDLNDKARFYEGGELQTAQKKTKIIVTEHEFRETQYDNQVELFDSRGVTVTNKLVVFDNPCHNIASDTLTIVESGANYAVVSGVGVLTGYEYTHNTALVEEYTGIEGDEDVKTISNNYLVSSLNSLNVAKREAAFCGFANLVKYDFVVTGDADIGDRVSFIDPFGKTVDGYIMSEDITMSGILKAAAQFITNWQPNHQGNAYNNYTIVSSGNVWNVPAELIGKPARIVLFSGFEGGSGGYDGQDGFEAYWERSDYGTFYAGGQGGDGGEGGEAGYRVRILTIDIPALAASYSYTLGEGGSGGDKMQAGNLGADSVFNGLSTAYGVENVDGWANPIDGTIYNDAAVATKGEKGGRGGNGGYLQFYTSSVSVSEYAGNGQNVGEKEGGKGAKTEGAYQTGGGGGGATPDKDGNDGGVSPNRYYGGNGGDGANAIEKPQAELGQCGKGANGGAGGGGGGLAGEKAYSGGFYPWYGGNGGRRGESCKGQKGSNGFFLVMHE